MYLQPNGIGHRCDYISDYDCIFNHPMDGIVGNQKLQYNQGGWQNLQDAKNQGWPLEITDLAHFTNDGAAKQIVKEYGFRGGLKKINEDRSHFNVFAKLSWWSPVFTDAEKNSLRGHLGEVIQPFTNPEEGDDLDALKNQFATVLMPSSLMLGGMEGTYFGMNKTSCVKLTVNLSMTSCVTKYWERLVTSRRLCMLFLYVAK